MERKATSGIMVTLLSISLLALTFNFQSAKATGSPVVSLNPLESTVQLGNSFTINVTVTNVTDLGSWEFRLDYNTTILNATSVSPTPYTANNTDWLPIDVGGNWVPINDTLGRVWTGALVPVLPGYGLNGSFPLVTINFTATAVGNCTLDLYKTVLGNSWAMPIAHTVIDGAVTVTTIPDTTPPTWSNAGANNTKAGQPTLFYVKWIDDYELSGFIFGTNNTGTWTNDTWTPMSGTTDWSNVTKPLTSFTGTVVQWRVWANDTSNNWNDTGILSLTTPQPPHAEFTYLPLTPYTSQNVTFNASASYDPDGTIVNYVWDFGDNTTSTGNITTHSYGDNGVYTVTLNVTDNDGLWNTFSADATVLNRPPVASFTENATTVLTGEAIHFDASSSSDPDGSIVSYFWDFGDGTNTTSTLTPTHVYTKADIYTVTLNVTDDDGEFGTDIVVVTVLSGVHSVIYIDPATTVGPTLTPGSNYTISIKTNYTGNNVNAWQFSLSYNANILHGVNVTNGDIITTDKDPMATFWPGTFNNTEGTLSLTTGFFFFLLEPAPLTSGPGTLANVTFTVVGVGKSNITLGSQTKLVGYTGGGYGDPYKIVDGEISDQLGHGYFNNVWPIHDVAITNVMPSKTVVGQGYALSINVTIANEGDSIEIFPVTPYVNATSIQTKVVTLPSGNSTTITLTWNTTGFTKGNYTLSAYAWPVPNETDTADNILIDGWVLVTVPGDVNGDGKCNILDMKLVKLAYSNLIEYPNADIDDNGVVNILDLKIEKLIYSGIL